MAFWARLTYALGCGRAVFFGAPATQFPHEQIFILTQRDTPWAWPQVGRFTELVCDAGQVAQQVTG